MGIKAKMNIDWEKVSEEIGRRIDERLIYAFQNACDDAVNYAKTNHKYIQQSGALNSSTGYQLYKNGSLVSERFEQSQSGTDEDGAKARGVSTGQKAARQRASELGARICAVVVAGMPYAIYVESKGKDVLSGAYLQFPAMLDRRMQEAFKNENIGYQIING
jgi:hypothetical protein